MAYQVTLSPAADKTAAKLPKPIRERVTERLVALGNDPRLHRSVKLTDEDAYRIRVGDY